MFEWIKSRAMEAHTQDLHAQRKEYVYSHSDQFFGSLAALTEQAIQAFNAEFPNPEKQIHLFEKGLNRFTLERKPPSAARVDCRLDQATHMLHYRIVRGPGSRGKGYHMDGMLRFEVEGKREVRLRGVGGLPMSFEEVTQLLLEPFFEF